MTRNFITALAIFTGTECYEWLLPIPHLLNFFRFKYSPIHTSAFQGIKTCPWVSDPHVSCILSLYACHMSGCKFTVEIHRPFQEMKEEHFFDPTHKLSSIARISGLIILAQTLDMSSFFSPTDFPIINCPEIKTQCRNIQFQYRRPFRSKIKMAH